MAMLQRSTSMVVSKNLTISEEQTGSKLWHEPKLTMQFKGSYDGEQDVVELSEAQVSGKVVNLAAKGQATTVSVSPNLELSGEYGYDLQGILAIFREMIGPDVQVTGNQKQQFVVRGPVFPAENNASAIVANELVAETGFGWESIQAYGIQLSGAQANATLRQGVVQTTPLELTVGNGGKLQVSPTFYLNSDPMWLTLKPGLIAENVRLAPEMTAGWMRYITPMLADATSAEGTFSVALKRGEIPLVDPTQAQFEGQLEFHGGTLGPGPMASQLLELASQIKRLTGQGDGRIADPSKTWVRIEPQQIDFRMAENRVHHNGFLMNVDGVQIKTRGSVDINDQSLAVTAEVPILDEWVEGTPNLAGLRGQVVSIPIHGTTSQPQLDQRALAQVSMQVARAGANGYLRNQLDKKLGGKLNDALGDDLGNVLKQGLSGFLGGQTKSETPANKAIQRPIQTPVNAPVASEVTNPNAGAIPQNQAEGGAGPLENPFINPPPAGNQPADFGTQLQNQLQGELNKQLDKLFK